MSAQTRTDRHTVRAIARAFSLVEVLVVMVIIGILVAIALPALNNILSSQEQSAAENRLAAGIAVARDAALVSGPGEDTAAVIIYDVQGPTRVVPAVKVGVLPDAASLTRWEIFVPMESFEPVSLPAGWTVRGYAPASAFTINAGAWYDTGSGEVERYARNQGNWVFPETSFYNHTVGNAGASRQTFMVRFQAQTGQVVSSPSYRSLLVLPRPSANDRDGGLTRELRADLTGDLRRYVARVLQDPALAGAASALIGPESSDMVTVRSVDVMALAQEADIAEAVGVRVDRISGCIYQVPRASFEAGLSITPAYVQGVSAALLNTRVNRYIEGYANIDAPDNLNLQALERPVRVYAVDRYGGGLVRLGVPSIAP
jgi:prepilin-type N-terminal cleavage/methylation domain-containing protein